MHGYFIRPETKRLFQAYRRIPHVYRRPYVLRAEGRYNAGGRADVKMLLPPGSEAHYYEPTLEDLAAINSCGLFIAAGGGIDAWCDKVISLCENDIRVLKLTDCVPLLEEAETEGMQEEHGHAHTEPETDEHVWTSPRNAAAIAARIPEEMSAADPLNAD